MQNTSTCWTGELSPTQVQNKQANWLCAVVFALFTAFNSKGWQLFKTLCVLRSKALDADRMQHRGVDMTGRDLHLGASILKKRLHP